MTWFYKPREETEKHPKCKGFYHFDGDFDCGYDTILDCEDCKYGSGRKDPEAKCNKLDWRYKKS